MAATLVTLLFASSAPSPLYVVFQKQWDFSAITLTSVFAVYAVALLAALLVTGSLSDHIGRRPVILGALVVEIAAMLVFAEARDVAWLYAGRTLQGVATGVAMGAISAALLDLQPDEKPWLGALAGVVCPMAGLALGALVTGILVQDGPDPTGFVFWLLFGAFVVLLPVVASVPETVTRDGEWRQSLAPRIGVPRNMRTAFARALPSLVATWALGGLVLSLGPSLTVAVLDEPSHVAAALPIFVMAGISGIASIKARSLSPATTARAGLAALIAGLALVLVAVEAGSNPLFLAAAAIAGLGFGPAFGGIFRALAEMAPADRRAELVSSMLTVAYTAFSLPAVAAGIAVTQIGLQETAEIYGAVLIALAGLALLLSGELDRMPDLATESA
jgi:MFS family permease